ncbi:MAG: alpha,alpha-trehalose phosphorylase [Phycisphaerales bacterium]|jgi:alpha,alpha-trehalose phosphorylase|nr:alpha,alpha-trehalose phosphorylase [Phycisphaerales bacterium]
MIRHDPVLPPEFIYPIDDWRWVERRYAPEFIASSETTFSTANGYLGMRGGFQEARPAFLHGTYINGFYETWPIPYGEKAFGFAKTGQTMVNVPDGKIIRLYVDDEPFTLDRATLDHYERALDMKCGTYERETLWETPSGKQVRIRTTRFVSFTERHVAAIRYEVTILNGRAPIVVASELANHAAIEAKAVREELSAGVVPPVDLDDPRLSKAFKDEVLVLEELTTDDKRVLMGYRTRSSGMTMACGMDHVVETENDYTFTSTRQDNSGHVVFNVAAEANKPFVMFKYLTYHTSHSEPPSELRARAARTLDRTVRQGFEPLLADQKEFVADFWRRSDVEISVPQINPRLQQCLRWNLFQMLQATARVENAGVPAKGLTGQAYEGHYFWDMEIYCLPFLIYTAPRIAQNLLKFRHGMLDNARQRAAELNQKGALFPWRTISGEEASAYYAAGTAQYHINAAIAYSIKKYVEITGDIEFLCEYGAEMLVETARLWFDMGFFSDRQAGKFVIHSVTGPDEYTTVVNNNAYTNMMARENLWYAAQAVETLRRDYPQHYIALAHETRLDPSESADWKRAADNMFIPYDERTKINPQDDSFLDREVWDLKNTPKENFPLLLHYHPLVIYRFQVIKQADIVLAMFLLGNEFSMEQKKRNFDYYDPLTTGDSSLSACIQSIVAAEIDYDDIATKYMRYAVLMDLADVGGNVKDGVHVASIGGTWMAIVYGLAGMRDYGGKISFNPKKFVDKLAFPLLVRGQRIEVKIEKGAATYTLRQGEGLSIWHRDEELKLTEGKPLTRTL